MDALKDRNHPLRVKWTGDRNCQMNNITYCDNAEQSLHLAVSFGTTMKTECIVVPDVVKRYSTAEINTTAVAGGQAFSTLWMARQ